MITRSATPAGERLLIGSEGEPMESDILAVIERAVAMAGYKIVSGDGACIIIQHPKSGGEYKLYVAEEP